MTINKQFGVIVIIVVLLCFPFLLGVFEANVGPQSNSVGTAQLRTATGSNTTLCTSNLNLTMNDYMFYPNAQVGTCSSSPTENAFNQADDGTTTGRVQYGSAASGSTTTRWRYVTTSDNPYWWACFVTATGILVSTWVADDPPTPSFVGPPMVLMNALFQPDPTISCRQIQKSDVQALNLPASSYILGDSWIRSHGYSSVNRDFRALQHAAGNTSPSKWLLDNFKIVGGVIMPMTVLPSPINVALP